MGSFHVSPGIMVYETSVTTWGLDLDNLTIKQAYDWLLFVERMNK
jgi:hypothetical protein